MENKDIEKILRTSYFTPLLFTKHGNGQRELEESYHRLLSLFIPSFFKLQKTSSFSDNSIWQIQLLALSFCFEVKN